ncbi:MAG: hypothetical protein ABSG33_02840 [Candidatus Bathyarchaeia archaeon]|jgi:hypothetical protein
MSQENKLARHSQNCKVAASMPECIVVAADVSSAKVPSQKRKEQAEPTLYLKRI